MKNLYLFLQNSVGLLVLCLVFSSCHRASYSFQPVSTSRPSVDAISLPAAATSSLATMDVPAQPTLFKRKSKPLLAGKMPGADLKAKARVIPAARLVRQPLPMVSQQSKSRLRLVAHQDDPNPTERHRSRGIAIILALVGPLIGIFGLHHFYLGYIGRGVAYLVVGLLSVFLLALGLLYFAFGGGLASVLAVGLILAGVVTIAQFADIIAIATGSLKPKNGAYNPGFFQTRQSTETSTPEQK